MQFWLMYTFMPFTLFWQPFVSQWYCNIENHLFFWGIGISITLFILKVCMAA
jgi:hypothetical protein